MNSHDPAQLIAPEIFVFAKERKKVRPGTSGPAAFMFAGSLRRRGLDAETIRVVLMEANRLRCEPPLADSEVIGIVQSISRYPAGSARYIGSSARRVRNDEGVGR
jgi:hypothetical protein